jgi:phosphatidate cytidylyltransferase
VPSLKTRVISSFILLPLALTAIVLGSWYYVLMISTITGLCCLEYVQMLRQKAYNPSLILVLAINYIWLGDALFEIENGITLGMAVLVLLTVIWILIRRQQVPDQSTPTAEWAMTLAGGTYLGIGGTYLLRLRELPDGLWWILTAFPIIWIGESVAYFVGSKWGKHKIAPTISPGKSWEGYIAEIVSSLITGLGFGVLWSMTASQTSITAFRAMMLGGILSSITPAGDFFVSMIKREVNVKDTGNLIPGHGGMFDRIDSLLWVGFITWTIATLFTQ